MVEREREGKDSSVHWLREKRTLVSTGRENGRTLMSTGREREKKRTLVSTGIEIEQKDTSVHW